MKQRYDSYKPSGIEWIGEIPSHWNVVRMRYLCDMITGDKDTVNRVDDGIYPFYVRSPHIERINSYTFDGEAVLMAGDGVGAGKVLHYANGKFNFHQRVYNFHNFKQIKGIILYQYLKSLFKYKIEEGGAKNTVDSVRQPWLKDFPVCVPPLAEQEAIALWIDEKCGEIDAAIAKVDREIELIDELKQSEISSVVTRGLNPNVKLRPSGIDWIGDIPEHWIIVPLRGIAKNFIKGSGITKEDLDDNGDIACVRYGDLYTKYDISFTQCVCFTNSDKISFKVNLQFGDILFAATGESVEDIGKNSVYLGNEDCLAGGDIIILRQSQNPLFISYAMSSDSAQSQKSYGKAKLKVVHLKLGDVKSIKIALPPISEQRQIADYLDKKCAEIDGLKSKLKKKRDTLVELRQAMISEVVTGKRKVI